MGSAEHTLEGCAVSVITETDLGVHPGKEGGFTIEPKSVVRRKRLFVGDVTRNVTLTKG
jgi:hypothetical protein